MIPLKASGRDFQALVIRTFDIVFSVLGLVVTAPLFPLIAALIKLDSKGPVMFPAQRVGKDMKLFPMYKFRTMLEVSDRIDQSVCPQYDPRVTTVGRFLRRTKLNELPQLLNVLKGEMSFVGPRPEAPDLAEMYPEHAKMVFSVKPGIVGPGVISDIKGGTTGRNEEELYPPGVDPKDFYIRHILPEKVTIDLNYLSQRTVRNYFVVILSAMKAVVFGAVSRKHARHNKRQIRLFGADLALSLISYALAWWLYARTTGSSGPIRGFLGNVLVVAAVRSLFHYGFGLYAFFVDLITPRDVFRVPMAVGLGSLLMLVLNELQAALLYPPALAAVDFCLLSGMLMAVRLFLWKRVRARESSPASDRRPRAVIFGANRKGVRALHVLNASKGSPWRVVGFIDDAEEKFAKKISGVKVLGNRHHLKALSLLHDVREVILAPDEGRNDIDEVVALCAQGGLRSRMFCDDAEGETGRRELFPIRALRLSDILPQAQVSLEEPVVRSLLPERTVLLFGSGGQLGSALCRNLFLRGCRKLVIVDRYESFLREILSELRRDLLGAQIVPAILDGRDFDALDKLFARHRPDIVIHAGMRKFIPLGGLDEQEVAGSNYIRTFNLAKAASRHGAGYFVMISSIKAVIQGNFLSESLRVAEISLSHFFRQTPTRLIVTRVGNIIENKGGIIAWLNDQILEQRLVRLPEESARAFHLSKNAAARSILQAMAMGSRLSPGGLILTSEPGISLAFSDVARRIANFYGIHLGVDVAVRFGEISAALVHDEPSLVSAGSDKAAADFLEKILASEHIDRALQRMIAEENRSLSDYYWRKRTDEIMAFYGEALTSKNRDFSSH